MDEFKITNLNGKILNPLIDFDFIVNTEMGLLRFIRDEYPDSRAFNLEILNKSDRELLSLLYSRVNPNPLSVISTEENLDHIDPLYVSFFKEKKREIIKRSITESSIMKFMYMMIVNGTNFGINPMISVSDDIEAASIIEHFGQIKICTNPSPSDIVTKDLFYIRDYRFFTDREITDIAGKVIYMTYRQYNINYFETEENDLTSMNEFVLIGTDFRLNKKNSNNEGENKNE